MKTPSAVEHRLMALVAIRSLTGRDVARLYREQVGKGISFGTLYTTFRRLKDEGLVNSRAVSDDARARYYGLTTKGVKTLARSREYFAGLAKFAPEPFSNLLPNITVNPNVTEAQIESVLPLVLKDIRKSIAREKRHPFKELPPLKRHARRGAR